MKYDIIKTDNYLLVVDDSEIKEGDYYLSYMSNKILQRTKLMDIVEVMDKKITAHLPLNNYPILESVPLLPPIEEDDVEKLAEDWIDKNSHKWSNNNNEVGDNYGSFIEGYNKAKEKYKFMEEDIAKAITYGWDLSHYHRLNTEEKLLKMQRDFIKSLSQPKMPIAFEQRNIVDGKNYISVTRRHDNFTLWIGKYIY